MKHNNILVLTVVGAIAWPMSARVPADSVMTDYLKQPYSIGVDFDLTRQNSTASVAVIKNTAVNKRSAKNLLSRWSATRTLMIPKQLLTNKWYHIKLNVNVEDRTVDYTMSLLEDPDEILFSGNRTVPEVGDNGDAITMYVYGINQLASRKNSSFLFDNIIVYFESSADYAAAPTIVLSRLGQTADEVENPNIRDCSHRRRVLRSSRR